MWTPCCYRVNHLGKNVTLVQKSISPNIKANGWSTKAHPVNVSLSKKTHRLSNPWKRPIFVLIFEKGDRKKSKRDNEEVDWVLIYSFMNKVRGFSQDGEAYNNLWALLFTWILWWDIASINLVLLHRWCMSRLSY